jgi:foldase protein PrsA
MFFRKMRKQTKTIVIIVCVAILAGLLYTGGVALFGGGAQQGAMAAVAKVNGKTITYYELQQVFFSELQELAQQKGSISGRDYEVARYRALDALIGRNLIFDEIQNRKITVPEREINAEYEELVNLFASKEEFQEQITAMGWTERTLKNALGEQLKVEKLQEQIAGDVAISEEEIKSLYEEVKASHILIRPDGDGDEAWEAARAEAEALWAELTPENFAELAQAHSDDLSAANGGDLGFFKRGVMISEFEEAAFALQVNEISKPIRSQFGYHIIMVTDRKDAAGEDFDAVRADLEAQLKDARIRERFNEWYTEKRAAANVEVIDHQIRAFQHRINDELEEAAHYYQLALEETPDDGYLYASLGDVYYSMDNLDEAIAHYEKAVDMVPGDVTLFVDLGLLYREVERYDEAAAALVKASDLAPNDIYTQLVLYNYLLDMERTEEAELVAEKITAYQERQAELQKQLLEAQGEEAEAEAEAEDEAEAATEVEAAETED